MTTVFVRDELRASVEGATGGQCTVLYSAQETPSYFYVLPKFNLEDIDPSLGTGPHPAFVINGVEVSKLFIGLFEGVIKNNELLSIPQLAPATNMSLENAATYARNCGAGFHLFTNAEWAAIALWCQKNEWLPSGNSESGRNYSAPHETGVRADGLAPGNISGSGVTLTGSGPIAWRHNNKSTGIADLVGNVREWVTGARLVDGELQVMQNNDAAAHQGAFHTADNWKAVRLDTGALVVPGTTGTVKMDSSAVASGAPPQNVGPFTWGDSIVNRLGDVGNSSELDYNGVVFADIESVVPTLLKTLALAPLEETAGMGAAYGRNYGARYFSRGGRYSSNAEAGLFGLAALDYIGASHFFTGARVVKY